MTPLHILSTTVRRWWSVSLSRYNINRIVADGVQKRTTATAPQRLPPTSRRRRRSFTDAHDIAYAVRIIAELRRERRATVFLTVKDRTQSSTDMWPTTRDGPAEIADVVTARTVSRRLLTGRLWSLPLAGSFTYAPSPHRLTVFNG